MNNENEELNFNIYYLNISKVYEIKMMIDNIVLSGVERENSATSGSEQNLTLGDGKKFNFQHKDFDNEYFKFKEFLEVKNTKSTYLKEIVGKCKNKRSLDDYVEGDLIKINNISLNFLDEELLQRTISLMNKDLFKGIKMDDVDVNTLFSSFLADYAYFLKGISEFEDEIILKIPMEKKSEFESEYNVNDLFIGNVSVIGIYKGKISLNQVKMTNMNFFIDNNDSNNVNNKIKYSNSDFNVNSNIEKDDKDKKFHYVDIIAIIQDVKFTLPNDKIVKLPWYKKIINFFR